MKKQKKEIVSRTSVQAIKSSPNFLSLSKAKLYLSLFLSSIAFLLYINTLSHDYTVDDATVMKNNKLVVQGVKAIPEIFASPYRKGFWERQESLYRPLSVALFALEWQLAPDNPLPGHAMNIALFTLTAFVLFNTLALLFKNANLIIPFAVTLLYITHPIHTEVVANIKSSDEIFCFLFTIISFRQFVLYFDSKKIINALLCAITFLLALLSKEIAITCILIFPMLLYFFRQVNILKSLKLSLFPFSSAGIYILIRVSVLKGLTNFTDIQAINNSIVNAPTYAEKFATAMMILGKYLLLLFIPHPLSFDYSFNTFPNVGISNGGALISVIIYLSLLVYALKEFKKRNVISFGILFLLLTISLVSNVLFLIESVMAERFTYMPSLGFCIALIFLIAKIFRAETQYTDKINFSALYKSNKLFFIAVFLLSFLFSIKTISRNADWKNNLTLLAADVKTNPESARIRYAYGSAILIEQALIEKDEAKKQALLDKSIVQLEKGVSILNTYADAFYHLGIAYKEKGDYARSVSNFELAAKHKTFTDANFFVAWGIACGKAKMYEQSIKALTHAVDLNPKQADAYNNLGVFYDEMNEPSKSIEALNKAIAFDSIPDGAYYNLGNTYAHITKYPEAIEWYKKALELNPKNVDAVNNIGNSYAAMQDYKNAIIWFRKVLEMDPNNAKAINNLGVTLMMIGQKEEGEKVLSRLKQDN